MKIRLVVFIVPLVVLALALAGGSVLLLRLFALSALALVFGYFWTLMGIRRIKGQVKEPPEHCQVGQWFDEETTVSNESRIPKLLIKAHENGDLPGHHNVMTFSLSPHSSHSWRTAVRCRRRGRYDFGALTATATDPLGLFSASRLLTEPQSILVYPATLELPFFQPLSPKEPAYSTSLWSATSEVSPNAARVREYTNGDRLNRIHWQSTAHAGKLMIKEFDPDRSNYVASNIWVIPDMCRASQLVDDTGTAVESCITIAASLVKKYIDDGKQVGFIASAEQNYLLQPRTGSEHLWQILEALAVMKATGEVPVGQLILDSMESFGVNSAIIVVTPSADQQLMTALRQLRNARATMVVILLDPISFGGSVSAISVANSLISTGAQVYVVKQDEELAKALDSRLLIPRLRISGEMVGSGR